MVLAERVLAITLSVYFSNAQNPQPSWQMPQYQAGGLSFLPVLKEFAQRELHDPQQQCTRDGQFVLVVARDATLPRINLESIQLLEDDPSGQCAPVATTATFAFYQFPVRSCGTKMMVRHNRETVPVWV
ncbi:hypothetical protein E1301_Tti022199 [Triplophysa tibetana]|uniref:ZP domain-containing protein n=1 Tax=Triplophysa tibetana TaxID=1572043 RepID=A0A5A9NXM6_9TELE|nr:hypothetical protein E1301_Tti022199 [Triplophysa tibetana]